MLGNDWNLLVDVFGVIGRSHVCRGEVMDLWKRCRTDVGKMLCDKYNRREDVIIFEGKKGGCGFGWEKKMVVFYVKRNLVVVRVR
jgi:hypothetical protein